VVRPDPFGRACCRDILQFAASNRFTSGVESSKPPRKQKTLAELAEITGRSTAAHMRMLDDEIDRARQRQ